MDDTHTKEHQTWGMRRLAVTVSLLAVLTLVLVTLDDPGVTEIESIPEVAVPVVAASPQGKEQDTVTAAPFDKRSATELVEPEGVFSDEALDGVLAAWDVSTDASVSVTIMDEQGSVVASLDQDRQFYAASMYKLYVAYEGYQNIDSGATDPDEIYIESHTRADCLRLMIRDSNSPCAEKMLYELGQKQLTTEFSALGALNTSLEAITTTSYDVARMLSLVSRGEGLSVASHGAYEDSLREQIFRDALFAGFSDNVTVYNKVGFRGFDEYHDAAIVELADGRRFIVSVMTNGAGTKMIAELAREIEGVITE